MDIILLGPLLGATCLEPLLNVCYNYKIVPSNQKIPGYDPRYEEAFERQLGSINVIKLRENPCFYASGNMDLILAGSRCGTLKELLQQQSNLLDNYFSLLWYQFDNAVYTNELCLFSGDGKLTGTNNYFVASNSLNRFEPVELTQQHIDAINDHEAIFGRVRELGSYYSSGEQAASITGDSQSQQAHHDVVGPIMEKYSFARLLRAHVLLRQARASSMKPVKATFYSILLECLLSSDDNAEVSHKVAERASLFVGESDQERMEIFRKVKKFYGLRSKFVHGQNIKQKLSDFEGLSQYVDEIVRRIFKRIFSDQQLTEIYGREDTDKNFDAYFFELLLSR